MSLPTSKNKPDTPNPETATLEDTTNQNIQDPIKSHQSDGRTSVCHSPSLRVEEKSTRNETKHSTSRPPVSSRPTPRKPLYPVSLALSSSLKRASQTSLPASAKEEERRSSSAEGTSSSNSWLSRYRLSQSAPMLMGRPGAAVVSQYFTISACCANCPGRRQSMIGRKQSRDRSLCDYCD